MSSSEFNQLKVDKLDEMIKIRQIKTIIANIDIVGDICNDNNYIRYILYDLIKDYKNLGISKEN